MILSPKPYQELLEEIPKWEGNYLEIGVWEGEMLRDFAERWPEKMFYGIDPFISDGDTTGHSGVPVGERLEANRARAYENFKNVPNINFLECTSAFFLANAPHNDLEKMKVGVVYIDGSHTYRDTLNDLCLSGMLMKKYGLIYIHDYDLPEVLVATEDFITTFGSRVQLRDKERIILQP